MAESRRYALGAQLDIEQILLEAQNRWLRPAEICEILRNHTKFSIAPEPANRPPNGSLFLFDRKVLRYFRKDGHNWRKKKDGKTVKEAHERLKAGSVDVLHCYYAHGEENENFQRRSYWSLDDDLSHIVLVHYREVKGSRTNYNRLKEVQEAPPNSQETDDNISHSEADSSISSKFQSFNNYPVASQNNDTTSFNSTHASEYEDAESAYNQQSSSRGHSFLELQPPVMGKMDRDSSVPYYPGAFSNDYQEKVPTNPQMDLFSLTQGGKGKNHSNIGLTYEPQKHFDIQSWESVMGNYNVGTQSASFQHSLSSTQPNNAGTLSGQRNEMIGQVLTNAFGETQQFGGYPHGQETWQASGNDPSNMYKWSMDCNSQREGEYNLASRIQGGEISNVDIFSSLEITNPTEQQNHLMQDNLQMQLGNTEGGYVLKPDLDGKVSLKPHFLEGFMKEGLKKLDSFDRWMSKELGDVKEPQLQSTSGAYWEEVENENEINASSGTPQVDLDPYILSPSLSQDQLFSIIDFSPSWTYVGSKIKVLITGRFLKSQQDLQNCKWACMFGEVEVPADIIADGVLLCHTPQHGAGTVPFYVTCSNRLACSEVREFDFQVHEVKDADMNGDGSNENLIHMRFEKLLSLGSAGPQDSVTDTNNTNLMSTINSLIHEDGNDWDQMFRLTSEEEFSTETVRDGDQLLQKLLKEKLHTWLLYKVGEGGKGASVLDEGGQGVLHFAAALGYDWAIPPTVAAGVSINFRDANGWTALHWAAYCGRERTVSFLISRGAGAGLVTDPTPKHPSGRTPADLAASRGHKGIAGYLAEAALSSHLESLKLKDGKEKDSGDGVNIVQGVCERTPTPVTDGDYPHGLSLKDSLAAVCNATQAAARIYQVFRVQSFQKKQLKEYGDGEFGLSDERALSLLALKTNKAGHHDEPVHAAATRIQNKFRSWKGRKDFLIIRQRIVKIQAHVRGHQVRKNYRKIVWSVGILDKVILRWRRKGSGLRGFKPEALPEASNMVNASVKDDDDDFLKKGRKQTEERLQKALARVKSMVQYPEARDQYRRLLNAVNDMQDTTIVSGVALESSFDTADFDNDLIDLEALLDDDDDTFMS